MIKLKNKKTKETKTVYPKNVTSKTELLSAIQAEERFISLTGALADEMEPFLRAKKVSRGIGTASLIGGFFVWPLWIVAGAQRIFDKGYKKLKNYKLVNRNNELLLIYDVELLSNDIVD